ncbi:TIGR04222 domain-containing membrane protein [Streptomyces solicathayae]|uniref:TIGR04222 domain-containing membrane protein n=1 Tax=Streptomyces solicathayae TaxID=3081768 RepID=A0ABZ0LR25_9ACTN|nr:TIGR04222 domain-containing membrane protein [Streptomyces sp. HUAS YS2]WOX21254.1 TIGR04222 domain-containing membrane protein [Streptomyces sp. HUAS YS2]
MATELWWFVGVACVQTVIASVLLRAGRPRPTELAPSALALLRGGSRAAVTVALVALHQRGAVAAGRRKTVRANGGPGATRDPLQRGVHASLHRAIGVGALTGRPRARKAVDALRTELGLAGLLRRPGRWRTARALLVLVPVTLVTGLLVAPWGGADAVVPYAVGAVTIIVSIALWRVPRITREARRTLADERARHPLPAHRRALSSEAAGTAERIQLYVALYGDAALKLFCPNFARDGGLLGAGRGNLDSGTAWQRVDEIPSLHIRVYRKFGHGGHYSAGCGEAGGGCGGAGGCGSGGGSGSD